MGKMLVMWRDPVLHADARLEPLATSSELLILTLRSVNHAVRFALGSGAVSSGWVMISGAPVVNLAYSVLRGSISTIPLSVIMYSRMSLL